LERELAILAIRERAPDFVALPEKSTLPLVEGGRARMHEAVRRFVQLAREGDAEVILFMTWAKFDEGKNHGPLVEAYDSIAAELDIAVAPVGVAFRVSLQEWIHPYRPDGSHPNVLGSYLAACLLYAAIYGEDPRAIPVDALAQGLPESAHHQAVDALPGDVAAVLQRIAGEVAVERGLVSASVR
jgi:hypothetical protein